MTTTALTRRAETATPLLMRLAMIVGLPLVAAATVGGTFLGNEIIVFAGWVALSLAGFLIVRPMIGIVVMTAAFLLAAYPTLLQALGALTINNLLGVCLSGLLAFHILEHRDFSFLRVRQVRVFIVIGVLLGLGSLYADSIFFTLSQTRGKGLVIDKTASMSHNFVARLAYLIFMVVFVRDRRDIRLLFLAFLLSLYVAVPSALWNMATGNLNRGFRVQASFTSGANPNRLAMICLIEVACWWFWSLSRPGTARRVVGLIAMCTCTIVLMGTGSRSGFLGLIVLFLLLQTGLKHFRVSAPQMGFMAVVGFLAILTIVPQESWERMINFSPDKGEIAASSNKMRGETVERAIEIFFDYPLTGIGLGNFREVSRQVYHDPFFRPPHNSYLWAASEGGVFVLLGYLYLFWITWRDLAVVKRLAHRDPEIGAAAAAVRVVFLLYCFFSGFADLWLNPVTYVVIGLVVTMRRYVESLPEPMATVVPRTGSVTPGMVSVAA